MFFVIKKDFVFYKRIMFFNHSFIYYSTLRRFSTKYGDAITKLGTNTKQVNRVISRKKMATFSLNSNKNISFMSKVS